MNEIIYTSSAQLRTPKAFLRELVEDLKAVKAVGGSFMLQNLRSQYRQSWLGYLWLIIPPLGTTLIWVYLSRAKILSVETGHIPYPIFVLSGVFLWQTFAEAIACPLAQLRSARRILTKIRAPHEAFILAGISGIIFNFAARMIVLAAAFFWYGVSPSATWLLVPAGLLSLLICGLALGWLVTPFGLLYADVSNGINLVVSFWFFITPIIYSNRELAVVRLNPLTPLLVTTRNWLTSGIAAPESGFFLVTALSVLVFAFAWIFYRLAKPHLIARI